MMSLGNARSLIELLGAINHAAPGFEASPPSTGVEGVLGCHPSTPCPSKQSGSCDIPHRNKEIALGHLDVPFFSPEAPKTAINLSEPESPHL